MTLETATPVGEFDVVGFSLQYELTYTNVLLMLDLGGIPLRAADRGMSDKDLDQALTSFNRLQPDTCSVSPAPA